MSVSFNSSVQPWVWRSFTPSHRLPVFKIFSSPAFSSLLPYQKWYGTKHTLTCPQATRHDQESPAVLCTKPNILVFLLLVLSVFKCPCISSRKNHCPTGFSNAKALFVFLNHSPLDRARPGGLVEGLDIHFLESKQLQSTNAWQNFWRLISKLI